ncbi:KRSC protein, partial [Grantiella picta]|nr:KRSC protein [Grantiella picta]
LSCPRPIAESSNEPCVRQCPESRALIVPPPVLLTLPGPVLSSCPQESIVTWAGPLRLEEEFSSRSSRGYGGS